MDGFAERLLNWFADHGRKDLPWQEDPSPYRVWVSEIMLQQTQVATVIPYYLRFTASFPDVQSLARANIDDVLHHWSGLGYYARARNLHQAASIIRDEYDGQFPRRFEDIVALPGIGRSTAGAILALSRGERHAILDGNVKRVLARFHATQGWPGKASVSKRLWEYAERHTPDQDVAAYTQAIMDLGATLCRRTAPICSRCPLSTDCEAHRLGAEAEFPGRRGNKPKPLRKTQMLLVHARDAVFLERRPPAGIWGGLWSFPEIDPADDASTWCEQKLNAAPIEVEQWQTVRHSFSHYDLDIEPTAVRVDRLSRTVADSNDHIWYDLAAPMRIGIAAPVAGLIEKLKRDESETNASHS